VGLYHLDHDRCEPAALTRTAILLGPAAQDLGVLRAFDTPPAVPDAFVMKGE
jgi:hypothetical protein